MAKRNDSGPNRLKNLSGEEIQARWRGLTPMFVKWLIISAVAAACIFLFNHFAQPGQKLTDILAVAYRIAAAGAVLFAFLAGMALVFSGRGHGK